MSLKSLSRLVLALLLVISLSLNHAHAQTQTPLEKAQSDYNFQLGKYKDQQDKYQTAKESYETFQTAVSKNNAFVETKNHLIQTNNLYIAFVFLVQEHANSVSWTKNLSYHQKIGDLLKEETAFFNQSNQRLNNTKTLEDLPPIARELDARIEGTTKPKVNKVKAMMEVGQTASVLEEFNSLSTILDRIVVFKLRAGETRSILANWATEIKDIREKSTSYLDNSRESLEKTGDFGISQQQSENITITANQSRQELKRSQPLFEELLRIL